MRVQPFLLVAAMLLGAIAVPSPMPSPDSAPSPDPVPSALSCDGQTYEMDPTREIIRDGGFESGLTYWPTTTGPGGANPPEVVTSPVHSGLGAAKVDAVESPATHANQSLAVDEPFVFAFSFDPLTWGTGGVFAANLMANWDPSAGTADQATAVLISSTDPQIRWMAWLTRSGGGRLVYFSTAWDVGVWHTFEILVDPELRMQCLSLDGIWLVSISLGEGEATFAPSQVIFGDISYAGDAGVSVYDDLSLRPVRRLGTPAGACPLSHGFWKNHPDAWPVDSLALGAETYGKDELRDLLRAPPRGDASLILAHQLIAAKLNVANGSDPAPVSAEIDEADALLAGYGGRLPYDVPPSSDAGGAMVAVASLLDDYNTGRFTADCEG